MTTDKVVELNIEYWGRVHDMCAGTKVKPWECIRWHPEDNPVWRYFSEHPPICSFEDSWIVEFAVDVLEDRQVWIGSVLYDIFAQEPRKCVVTGRDETGLIINDDSAIEMTWVAWETDASWTPPAPKRTFTLNGGELPCPVEYDSVEMRFSLSIEGSYFYFDSTESRNIVRDHIKHLLTEARDKP